MFAAIFKTATSEENSRTLFITASSVVLKDGKSSLVTLSNVTPGVTSERNESERCSEIAAEPSCKPLRRFSGVKRHDSSRP